MNSIKNKKQSVLIALLFILSACDDNHDLVNYINEAKKYSQQTLEPDFSFMPIPLLPLHQTEIRRNPFHSLDAKGTNLLKQSNHLHHPLTAFSLDKLQFVGLLQQRKNIWALIKDPNKRVLHVGIGDYVGINNGRVIAIKKNQIIVHEYSKIFGVENMQKKIIYLNDSVRT